MYIIWNENAYTLDMGLSYYWKVCKAAFIQKIKLKFD